MIGYDSVALGQVFERGEAAKIRLQSLKGSAILTSRPLNIWEIWERDSRPYYYLSDSKRTVFIEMGGALGY